MPPFIIRDRQGGHHAQPQRTRVAEFGARGELLPPRVTDPATSPRMSILRTLLVVAATTQLCAAVAGAQDSPFQTRACPVPGGMQGYPVWVGAADGAGPDSAWTRSVADAAARRWEPPSRRRGGFPGLNRLRSRVQPPEPRWPDDWAPSATHVARVEVTLRRDGRPDAVVTAPSGDRAFDRSVAALWRDGAPGSPDLPPLPAGVDSVRLVVGFGTAPREGAQVVRFAVQQRPLEVVPGTLNVTRPAGSQMSGPPPAVTVKYDVDVSGRIVPGSIEVLDGRDRAMAAAVEAGLLRARFAPAQSNCRPVALSVVQIFGGR